MNMINKLSSLSNLLMNKYSSVFLASDAFKESFLDADNLLTRCLRAFLQFFYFACKWLMYMVDVIYFYILQLVGVSSDTSIFDSSRSDPAFRLLIDNKEEVTSFIKSFAAIAIILIIVTAVIAIIKMQAQALKDSKPKKSPTSDVLKSIVKSVILIIVTPLIAILSIIASSVLLQGLYRATSLSDAKSLSSRIFNASATAANKYKAYADNGVRIPIKYNFSGDDKAEAIVYASNMLGTKSFPSLDYFNENETYSGNFYDPVYSDKLVDKGSYETWLDAWLNDTYYNYFDTSEDYNAKYNIEKHKIMKTHPNEYYAMSDVMGYALDTMDPYYFVTIQEMLEAIADIVNDETEFEKKLDGWRINLLKINGDQVDTIGYNNFNLLDIINNGNYDFIQYTSTYADGDHTYVHVKDALDEMEGAKFTIAYKAPDTQYTYTPSLYGDHVQDTSNTSVYHEIETFFFKEGSRYKKVELYYTFNPHNGRYEKATTFDGVTNVDYFYRIGEDYFKITEQNKDKFFYKLNGNYTNFNLGNSFYSKTSKEYYMPLVNGVNSYQNTKFISQYTKAGIITARGIFDEASYPTAIRRLNNGNIMFYRDDLEIVSEGSISDVGKLEDVEAESDENSEEQCFFDKVGSAFKTAWSSVKKFISSIFNPLKMVPDLAFDESRISSTYTNKTKSVAELGDGKLQISYFFSDSITSKLTKNNYSLDLNYLYEPLSINYIILVVGSVLLFKVISTAVFGIINRALSLFMMILIYPLACSTIPLDDANGASASKSGSYKKWSERYTKLLFTTFGLILGINFVFIIIPIIDNIVFFTAENLVSNVALARIANALYNPLTILGVNLRFVEPNYQLISVFLNKILRIIFQLAAFSLVASVGGKGKSQTFYSVIKDIVSPGGEDVLADSPLDAVKKLLKSAANIAWMVISPGTAVKNMVEKSMDTMKDVAKKAGDLVPGSALINEAGKNLKTRNLMKNQDDARKALISAMQSGASKEEVEDKLATFKSTHNMK